MGIHLDAKVMIDSLEEGQAFGLVFALAELIIYTYPEMKDDVIRGMDSWAGNHFWMGRDMQEGWKSAISQLHILPGGDNAL
jgi:hypothetical protein